MSQDFNIFPLGDSAATIDLGNRIDVELNLKVLAMQHWLSTNSFEGLKDVIVAYSSLSVFYDPILIKKKMPVGSTVFEYIKDRLKESYDHGALPSGTGDQLIIRIPVCYEAFGFDLDRMALKNGLTKEEIIHLHTAKSYRVYMIGFLPGFSYLGEVDEKLIIPRKAAPVSVAPGSVGIAGSQTGIYPLNCLGGWQIIGRTPVKIFDADASPPVLLRAGDRVQFYSITREAFDQEQWTVDR